ncbi:MAG: 2-amino-4-hydroxy-6-hydroxymethyldihydropteridine diphosphokinase [Epsilonproteobacteria bacterium]|nr:2-amino-4-hydroxy-6-hydroxymethyldihydropteridine diphosphokinase [Campylobacterota bacterium]
MYLTKRIENNLTHIKGTLFPYVSLKSSPLRYKVIIGIGGNMGDTKRVFDKLFYFFQREKLVSTQRTSSILKNPPFGYLNQPFFFNSVMILETNLRPHQLLRYLLHVEKRFRRKRSFSDAPRTLDLDILFYENKKINKKDLTIPHPHWFKRTSVVIPLMEVIDK